MNKELLHHLSSFVNAVTRGDYCKGQEVTRMATGLHLEKNEKDFLESLELMSVKLEAREFCLEEAINDLRTRNAELMEEKQRNRLFSTIFVSLFLAVTLYIFLIFLAGKLHSDLEGSARIVEAIFLVVCILIVRKSGLPLSSLGVTLQGAAQSLRLMVPGTVAACAGLVALKSLCIRLEVPGLDQELFILDNFDLLFVVYLPIAVFQEFLARGVIQTAIESVLATRNATLWAIVTASALFGLVHMQLSVEIAVASFVCGLYWGYLYFRRRCLVGVSLSHFMIGAMAYVLGFWDYLIAM
jgi:membrane protease YdiL (CAAX protease family)